MDDQDFYYINPDLLFEATRNLSDEDILALLHDVTLRIHAGDTENLPDWVKLTEPMEGAQSV